MTKSFLDFPVEINLQILRECCANDITCFSLTCKYLYIISTELRTPRLSLSTLDARLCPSYSCSNTHDRNRACNILRRHRRICHLLSLAVHEGRTLEWTKEFTVPDADCNECQTPLWTPHCECFAVTLYKRLETWMPRKLHFYANCRIFTRGCGHDGRFCAVHVRRAKWELARKERAMVPWQMNAKLEEDYRINGESSAKGAATELVDLDHMQLTRERMRREAKVEMQKRMDELKVREEEVKKKERGLRKREEELWRRRDKLKELEDRLRKREDQLKKAEDEFIKKGNGYKNDRYYSASPRSSIGFTRCPCRET